MSYAAIILNLSAYDSNYLFLRVVLRIFIEVRMPCMAFIKVCGHVDKLFYFYVVVLVYLNQIFPLMIFFLILRYFHEYIKAS